MLLRPNYREFVSQGRSSCRCTCVGVAARASARSLGSLSRRRPRDRARRRAALGHLHRRRASRTTCARRCRDRGPHRRLPRARAASSTWPRPTSTPASGSCSAAEGWDDVPISSAVRASTALPMVYAPHRVQGPRARRRRHRLHHQPRHRGRGGREVHRRRQPARPLRQRLHEGDPDAVRHPHAPRLGHGLPEDRLPDVQAARLPAPARDGARAGRSATRASTSS